MDTNISKEMGGKRHRKKDREAKTETQGRMSKRGATSSHLNLKFLVQKSF